MLQANFATTGSKGVPRARPVGAALNRLKTRELETVLCLQAGDKDQEIATYLGISASAVRRSLKAAAERLGVNGRAGLMGVPFSVANG